MKVVDPHKNSKERRSRYQIQNHSSVNLNQKLNSLKCFWKKKH